jgi:hypothetical protein
MRASNAVTVLDQAMDTIDFKKMFIVVSFATNCSLPSGLLLLSAHPPKMSNGFVCVWIVFRAMKGDAVAGYLARSCTG